MLWFGVTVMDVEDQSVSSQEIHGPFEDAETMTEAIDERIEEATSENQIAVPLSFELCTDDVPEVVDYESAGH
jgi:hypothetical protein